MCEILETPIDVEIVSAVPVKAAWPAESEVLLACQLAADGPDIRLNLRVRCIGERLSEPVHTIDVDAEEVARRKNAGAVQRVDGSEQLPDAERVVNW